jgi:hypothetical protein
MTTKHTPAQIDVEPHVQGEIPDTGTYAGELYMLATPKRIRACNTHAELVDALANALRELECGFINRGLTSDAAKRTYAPEYAALAKARGEA